MKNMTKDYQRKTGTFYTPKIWVDEAHKEITSALGPNWKEEYVVWDCAAGTANLTRDYQFKELYISTLEQADINTINDMGYNDGAVKFQYDFLSECGIDSVPDGIKKAMIEKKKLLFFINPPYGRPGQLMGHLDSKDTVTNISISMKREQLGCSSSQLYSQFIYKISKLKELNENINFAIFCPPVFMSSGYSKFYIFLTNRFILNSIFIIRPDNFCDVDMCGSISFSLWR